MDDLPPAYGTNSYDSKGPTLASVPPAPATGAHNPLAPTADASPAVVPEPPQHASWHHYPEPSAPPAPAATGPSSSSALGAAAAAAQQAGSKGHYPTVPVPADYPISLGSPGSSGSFGGSPSGTPHAGAVGGSQGAVAAGSPPTYHQPAAMAPSNPELRITVLNPLRHMGPSAVPGE